MVKHPFSTSAYHPKHQRPVTPSTLAPPRPARPWHPARLRDAQAPQGCHKMNLSLSIVDSINLDKPSYFRVNNDVIDNNKVNHW